MAFDQGPVGEILPVHLQKVKDAVDDRVLGHLLWRRPGNTETLLESGEGRLVTVVGHDLAVEQETPGGLSRHSGVDLGVGGGEILARTKRRSRTSLPTLRATQRSPSNLRSKNQSSPKSRSIGQCCQHEPDLHANIVSRGRGGTRHQTPRCKGSVTGSCSVDYRACSSPRRRYVIPAVSDRKSDLLTVWPSLNEQVGISASRWRSETTIET